MKAASLIAAFTLCAARLSAQSDSSLIPAGSGTFVAVSVANLQRMVGWYRDTLGFSVYHEGTAQTPNGPVRFTLMQQGNSVLELLQMPNSRADTTSPWLEYGFFKSGFVVADIDRVYGRVRAMGVRREYEMSRLDGPYRSFGLKDPEGNLLQFFGR